MIMHFFESKTYEDYLKYCSDPGFWEKNIYDKLIPKIFECSVAESEQKHKKFFEVYTLPMALQACENKHYEGLKRLGIDTLQYDDLKPFIESILSNRTYLPKELKNGRVVYTPKARKDASESNCKDLYVLPGLDVKENENFIDKFNKAIEGWIEFYILDISIIQGLSRSAIFFAGYEALIIFYLIHFSISRTSFLEKNFCLPENILQREEFTLAGYYSGLKKPINDRVSRPKKRIKFNSSSSPDYSASEQYGDAYYKTDYILEKAKSINHFLNNIETPSVIERMELAIFSKFVHLLNEHGENVRTNNSRERREFLEKLMKWADCLNQDLKCKLQTAINVFSIEAIKTNFDDLGTDARGNVGNLHEGRSFMWSKKGFAQPLSELWKSLSMDFDISLPADLFADPLPAKEYNPKRKGLSFDEINNIYHILNAQGQSLISPIFESVQKNIQPEYDPLAQKIIDALRVDQVNSSSPIN